MPLYSGLRASTRTINQRCTNGRSTSIQPGSSSSSSSFAVPPDLPLPPARSAWPLARSQGGTVLGLIIAFVVFLLVFVCVGYRDRRARAAAAAAPVQRPPGLPRMRQTTAPVQPPLGLPRERQITALVQPPRLPRGRERVRQIDELVRQLQRVCAAAAANPPPTDRRLPAFTYSRRTSPSGGEEETCSVCLAAFRLGETVRLLPACLHLYHAECIDPWLDAHSTWPLCRSDADPSTDVTARRLPPV